MRTSSSKHKPLDGVDGWELVEFTQINVTDDKKFVYYHPHVGEVAITRSPTWRRR